MPFSYEISMVWPPVLVCPTAEQVTISPHTPVCCSVYVTASHKRASLTRTLSVPDNDSAMLAAGEGDQTGMKSMVRSGSSPAEMGRIQWNTVCHMPIMRGGLNNEDPFDSARLNKSTSKPSHTFECDPATGLSSFLSSGDPGAAAPNIDHILGHEVGLQICLPQNISANQPEVSIPSRDNQTLLILLPLGPENWSQIETQQSDADILCFSSCVSMPISLIFTGYNHGGFEIFRKLEICLVSTKVDSSIQHYRDTPMAQISTVSGSHPNEIPVPVQNQSSSGNIASIPYYCIGTPVLIPFIPRQQSQELFKLLGTMTIELAMPVLVLAAGDTIGGFLDSLVGRIASASRFEDVPKSLKRDFMKGFAHHWQPLIFDLSLICNTSLDDAISGATTTAIRSSGSRSSLGTITSEGDMSSHRVPGSQSGSGISTEATLARPICIVGPSTLQPAGPHPVVHHQIRHPTVAHQSASHHFMQQPNSHPLSDSSLRSDPQSDSQSSSLAVTGSKGSGSFWGSGASTLRTAISTLPGSTASRTNPNGGHSQTASYRDLLLPLIEHCTSYLSASEWCV